MFPNMVGDGQVNPFNSLTVMNIESNKFKELPANFGELFPNLQTLSLNYCHDLAALPDNFGTLKHLQNLNM